MTLDKIRKFILQNSPKSGQEILDFIDKVEVVTNSDGVFYYKGGKLRIEDNFYYLKNNIFHREDGPAIEWANGKKEWYLNGKRHRTDGPAIEYPSGTKSWWINGKEHREDGPAVEYASGLKYWCLNGIQLSEQEFNKRIKP